MVYPPPVNDRASVAYTFEDATRIRAAEKNNGLISSVQREFDPIVASLKAYFSAFVESATSGEANATFS
jgi:hypothetical protein